MYICVTIHNLFVKSTQ